MISNIRLQHFRSYADESFEFDPGVNIIVGPNASGKTNLLEAVLVLCLGKSYRIAKDAELLAYDQPWARLDGEGPNMMRTVKLMKQPDDTIKKEFIIQDTTYKRLVLQKTIPIVLFEPNHLLLLSGSPELRREYIDSLIEQVVPGFGTLRRQYKRALAQRNALLKNGVTATSQLFAWNIRLSQLGGQLVTQRLQLIEDFAKELSNLYQELSKTESTVLLQYQSNCLIEQYSSDMLHKLEHSMQRDLERGFTTYGPHRDDFSIQLNDKPVQEAASRGETRTLLLGLKILELRLLEEKRGQKPILLLDDVFSELDGARRRALTETLKDHQTFITTTDADVVVQHFMGNCNIVAINRAAAEN